MLYSGFTDANSNSSAFPADVCGPAGSGAADTRGGAGPRPRPRPGSFGPDPDGVGGGALTQTHLRGSVGEPRVSVPCVRPLFKIRHFNPEKSSQTVPIPSVLGVVSFWPQVLCPGPPDSTLAGPVLQWVFSESEAGLLRNHVIVTSPIRLLSGPVLSTCLLVPAPVCNLKLSSGHVKKRNKK